MTASEILAKYENEHEYHFHELDRKWIIDAMEDYKHQMLIYDIENSMTYLFEKWVDELTKEGDYPTNILVPVKLSDIKKSELHKYTEYIDIAYQKANAKKITEIFDFQDNEER